MFVATTILIMWCLRRLQLFHFLIFLCENIGLQSLVCCSSYHFVVVMLAVAAVFHVVSLWAFLLAKQTCHLSTEHRVSQGQTGEETGERTRTHKDPDNDTWLTESFYH